MAFVMAMAQSAGGASWPDFASRRDWMVATSLRARGISEPRVLEAMAAVPRERFVPPAVLARAYEDTPLPIASGQTISQPYMVALMLEAVALRAEDKVLEIGTGSGYGAAVLGHLAREVHSIERLAPLANAARQILQDLGYANVVVWQGDGAAGLPSEAPFDAIIVTAAAPSIPPALLGQLASGGRLVMPVGEASADQTLRRLTRAADGSILEQDLGAVRFVPLIGGAPA
jgi:protein-L-isoaspartate(D-aspartate) O-methyltransferase